jgi:hypothetical protein
MHQKILWTMTVACLALVVGAAWPAAQAQDPNGVSENGPA